MMVMMRPMKNRPSERTITMMTVGWMRDGRLAMVRLARLRCRFWSSKLAAVLRETPARERDTPVVDMATGCRGQYCCCHRRCVTRVVCRTCRANSEAHKTRFARGKSTRVLHDKALTKLALPLLGIENFVSLCSL